MSSKIKIVRNAYLYIASLISLLFVAIGAYTLLNTAIKTYVLPKAERGGFSRCNEQPPVYALDTPEKLGAAGVTTEDQKAQIEQMLKDYERWKENNTGEECYRAERQNNVANAITMMVIALPIFLFHWRLVKREKEEKETQD